MSDEQEVDLHNEYKDATEVTEDDALAVEMLLAIERIGNEIGLIDQMFHSREIEGYETLERLKVLFELVEPLIEKINSRI